MGIATDLIYIVIAALAGGFLAHLFKQPLIFGYILAGVLLGPHTGGLTVKHIHDIEMLAEIGVALLLFTIGLEFSFGELKRLSRITLVGTPLQILLCAGGGYAVSRYLGVPSSDALWIGSAISLSSTMVVLKTLISKDLQESPAGRIMLAILIAQDLAVIPIMLLLPQLTQETIDMQVIGTALLKSGGFLVVMYFAGTRLLPRLFAFIARWGSRELFFLATLGVALGTGYVSQQMGLSFALGAFVAGMLFSETDFSHQALSDVSGLKDLFSLIFFVSVGMLFDPSFFVEHFSTIAILVVAVVVLKSFVTGGMLRLFGYSPQVAILSGLGLSQIGEFAFVIINVGSRSGTLSADSFSYVISVTVVSMMLTPCLFMLGRIFSRNARESIPKVGETLELVNRDLSGHVVIVGGGVVGEYVARVLTALERSYVVIESDYRTATHLRDRGVVALFGDGTHRTILEAAKTVRASLVVIATHDDAALPLIVGEVRGIRTDIPIVARAEEVEDLEALSKLNVREIVQPKFEVGLEMVRQALLALNVDEAKIFSLLGHLRTERYEPKSATGIRTEVEAKILRATKLLELRWYELSSALSLVGSSLQEAKLREKFGISVVALVRSDEFIPTPRADLKMEKGDLLGVLGTRAQLELFKAEVQQS